MFTPIMRACRYLLLYKPYYQTQMGPRCLAFSWTLFNWLFRKKATLSQFSSSSSVNNSGRKMSLTAL